MRGSPANSFKLPPRDAGGVTRSEVVLIPRSEGSAPASPPGGPANADRPRRTPRARLQLTFNQLFRDASTPRARSTQNPLLPCASADPPRGPARAPAVPENVEHYPVPPTAAPQRLLAPARPRSGRTRSPNLDKASNNSTRLPSSTRLSQNSPHVRGVKNASLPRAVPILTQV